MPEWAKPSVSLFEKILSLTHAEGISPTVYSTLCDLKNKKVYLYNLHNYKYMKEIDLPDAFKNGEKQYMIRSFFPAGKNELIFRIMKDCIANFEDLPQHSVSFKVNSPGFPDSLNLFVQGSAKGLGKWDEPGKKMNKVSGSEYELTMPFNDGEMFDFAIASERCKYIPLDSTLSEINEKVIEVKSDTTVVIEVFRRKER